MKIEISESEMSVNAANTIVPMLRDLPANVQGGALADLVARWIVGHQTLDDDRAGLEAYREQLLAAWLVLMRRLVPVNEKMMADFIAGELAKRRRPQ
jgi:hypothetical protein